MSHYVDVKQLESFSIVEFLARLGYHAARKSGKNHFYHSMLRETGKNTPSLAVWEAGNCWKDWGGAGVSGIFKGGIVQLGMAYWPELSYLEVLHKISEVANLDVSRIPEYIPPKIYPVQDKQDRYDWELVKIQQIGTNPALTDYLKKRGVYQAAHDQVFEVYYRKKEHGINGRLYFGVGWKNELGGLEFSNALGFKSSIGAKAISVIKGSADRLVVFEGYMDYLSWLTLANPFAHKPTVIVLNAGTMAIHATAMMKDYESVELYMDNDAPGRQFTQSIIDEVPHAKDCSSAYAGYNDYNEMLMHSLNEQAHQFRR